MEATRQRWIGRPWAARAVRSLSYLVPFAASIAVAFVLSSYIPAAPNLAIGILRWAGIASVSTVVLVLTDRVARRILPLSALLNLTLAFPDQAPSRFRIAIRSGTTRQLEHRLREAADGDLGETANQAAVRLLELVGMLAIHDRLTRGHSERVRAYTQMIGSELGISGEELDRMHWAGLLHDVGKLAIDTAILNKPGKLTAEEYEVIKTHPMEGKKLVEPLVEWLGDAARAVWEHHERFDGDGYPAGLKGHEISYAARIVSVADTYDVMTSIRTYKKPMPSAAAREELARCAGTQFDPEVVRAFLNLSLGRLRMAMGPFSWLAQLALFPQVAAAQAAGSVAAGTAVAVGAAAGTIGMAAAPVDADEAVPMASPPAATQVDDRFHGGWAAAVALVSGGEAFGFDPAGSAAPVSPGDAAAPAPDLDDEVSGGDPPPTTTEAPPTSSSVDPPAATDASPTAEAPPTTSSVAPPATPPGPPPTSTTSPPPATTTTTTSPASPASTTTTTTVPLARLEQVYLAPSGPGDTVSQTYLPLVSTSFPDIPLPNYDTDRDAFAGLVIAKDKAGVGGSDPTTIQHFTLSAKEPTLVQGEVTVHVIVAAKDFSDVDINVEAGLYRCSTSCRPLAVGDKWVPNASRFKPANLDLGALDLVLAAGERLELRIAVLDGSGDDAWLAFGTHRNRSWIDVETGDDPEDAALEERDDGEDD